MYQVDKAAIRNLRRNDCLMIHEGLTNGPLMETAISTNWSYDKRKYWGGEVVVCLGKVMQRTGHYEPQPFYRILTTDGRIALITKATRRYFKSVSNEK